MRALEPIKKLWSVTGFEEPGVGDYADKLILNETRRGLVMMATLSLVLHLAGLLLYYRLGLGNQYLYTYGLLAGLSLHVVVSARAIKDLRTLHLLGMVLLLVTGLALVLLAHKTGTLSLGLMTGIVLLIMLVPLVPWGLRETSSVLALVYILLTGSTLSVDNRFDDQTLFTFQFLILAATVVTAALVARNVYIRKSDIRLRYNLEQAHREMELLSMQDGLTGVWNRRFFEMEFDAIASRTLSSASALHFALLDIDRFKQINDTHGHEHGDRVLKHLAEALTVRFGANGYVVRLGGDEFVLLFSGDDPVAQVNDATRLLHGDAVLCAVDPEPVHVSVGIATAAAGSEPDRVTLYKQADANMYAAKVASKRQLAATMPVAETG